MNISQEFQSNTSNNLFGTNDSQTKPSPINSEWFRKQNYTGSTEVSLRAQYSIEEILYYEALFGNLSDNGQFCDANKAAPFLKKSGTKIDDLKNIWRSVATDPKKLEKEEFFHFCKYLAAVQNNVPTVTENLQKPMKVAIFEGVDANLIITEQQKLLEKMTNSPSKDNNSEKKSTTSNNQELSPEKSPAKSPEKSPAKLISQPQYSIEGKKQTYEKFAVKLADQNEMIKMADCKGYLNNSGIDVETLKKIVYLTNPNNTESISMDEFCMMLHLIFLVKKENLLVPETLPLELSYLRRDFVKDLAKSNVSANEIVVVKDQVAEADKQRLMDLTEFRKKYEAVQQKGMANLEKVRKNNQESLMKKNADLEFMNKVLENYKNL